MGPKKKEGKDKKAEGKDKTAEGKDTKNKLETDTKPKTQFLTKDRTKLKQNAKDRSCFSLVVHTETTEETVSKPGTKFSAPELPFRESRVTWPPLDIFTPVNNYEVPRVTVWTPFSRECMDQMKILNDEDTYAYIENKLPPEYSAVNKHFIKYLIYDILRWAWRNNLNDKKASSLLGMYLNTHNYFLGSTHRNQKEIYNFFKHSILLHTIDDPPKSAKILEPLECKSGLLYFCHTYLPALPLLRVQLLPNYRLKLQTSQKKEDILKSNN